MTVTRRQLLVAGTAGTASIIASSTPTVEAAPLDERKRRFPGDPGRGRLYYGAVYPWDKSIPAWENKLGHRLGVHRSYYNADQVDGMLDEVRTDLRHRRLPHVSIKAPGTWGAVAAGHQDRWVDSVLERLGRVHGPVIFTVHHEPENDEGGAGMRPSDFVKMQRRIIRRCRAAGSRNVSVTPVLMSWTFDSRSGRRPRDWVVPEARLFGMNAYNQWSSSNGNEWRSFPSLLRPAFPYVDGRPIVIGEYATRTDHRHPGRAARWMRNTYKFARTHNVVAMSYFNTPLHSPEGSWELDAERSPVFRRKLHRKTSVLA